jgi:hypothetical protein
MYLEVSLFDCDFILQLLWTVFAFALLFYIVPAGAKKKKRTKGQTNKKKSGRSQSQKRRPLKSLLRNPIAIAVIEQLLANLIWTAGVWGFSHVLEVLKTLNKIGL